MRGRIIIYFSLGFIIGASLNGILHFYFYNEHLSSHLLVLSILFIIPLTFLFHNKKSVFLLITTAIICGVISSYSGGINRENSQIISKTAELKDQFSSFIDRAFSDNMRERAIIKAIIIGDKSSIDNYIRNDYKKSGAMHLLALSGMHVGIIYKLLSLFLSILGNSPLSKHLKKGLILISLWFYAIITGLSSSISRAVIMISVYEVSDILSSDKNLLRALSISALITTIINPSAPFEIGFQLSYTAMVMIYFLNPILQRLLESNSSLLNYIWKTLSMSISCQIGTGILAFIYFGTFPKYFMITNLLAIPLTGIIINFIPLALILEPFRPAITELTALLNTIIHIIATID